MKEQKLFAIIADAEQGDGQCGVVKIQREDDSPPLETSSPIGVRQAEETLYSS